MASYIVRVELHLAPAALYDDLHKTMEAEGFSKTLDFGPDEYHLPRGEYHIVSARSPIDILEAVKRTAKRVWPEYGVLVSASSDIKAFGLHPVR